MAYVPNCPFFWPPAIGTDRFTAAYYGAGLDPIPMNLKEVYLDLAQTIPLANPVPFNVEGYVVVVLGNGGYKLVIRDPDCNVVFTQDPIQTGTTGGTGTSLFGVNNLDELRAWGSYEGFIYMGGYYADGDGGHGMFWWDAADETPDDSGYTIMPLSAPIAGRWKRIPDEDGKVRAASFGYVPTVGAELTSNLSNADFYAASVHTTLLIGTGVAATITGITFTAPIVEFEGGARLNGTSVTVNFSGLAYGPPNVDLTSVTVHFSSYQVSERPEWFGAQAGGFDNTATFAKWIAAGGGSFQLPPGEWHYANVSAFPWPGGKEFILLGVLIGVSDNFGPGSRNGEVEAGAFVFNNGARLVADGSNIQSTVALEATDFVGPHATIAVGEIASVLSTTVDATGDITSGGSVYGAMSLITDGFVAFEAGASGSRIRAAGRLLTVTGAATTVGIGATNLLSGIITQNTLAVDGQALRIMVGGNVTTMDSKNISITLGGQVVFSATFTPAPLNSLGFTIYCDVIRTAATTVFMNGYLICGSATASYPNITPFSVTAALSTDLTLQVVGTSPTSGIIINRQLFVDYYS